MKSFGLTLVTICCTYFYATVVQRVLVTILQNSLYRALLYRGLSVHSEQIEPRIFKMEKYISQFDPFLKGT